MLIFCCKTSVFSRASHLTTSSFLPYLLILVLLAQSVCVWAKSASENSIGIGFVAFNVGEYRREQFGQVGKIFNQLQSFPKNTPIKLIGHSHSTNNLASSQLASIRASGIRDQLINLGIAAESISIDDDVQNFVTSGQLLHGVTVLVFPETQTTDEGIQSSQPRVPAMHNTASSSAPSVQASAVTSNDIIEAELDRDSCSLLSIYSGSLRSNLEREIGDCGYIMGRWRFGSGDEVIDWHVPVAYSTMVDDGIIGLLQLIERNYQIRGHIHQLDQSIDFFPSIRDRGNRSQ